MRVGRYAGFIGILGLVTSLLAGCTGSSGGHDHGVSSAHGSAASGTGSAASGTGFGAGVPSGGSATGLVQDVDAHGPTAVLLGSVLVAGHERPAFDRSLDAGATWRPASVDAASQARYGSVEDTPVTAAWTRLGWVAAGWASHGYAVWTSPDGAVWQRRPTIPAAEPVAAINGRDAAPFSDASWLGVYPSPGGVAIATEPYSSGGLVFHLSGDARTWTDRPAVVAGLDGPTVESVAVRGDTLVVVGYGQAQAGAAVRPFITVSTDAGLRWRPADVPAVAVGTGPDNVALPSVTATPAGFAALSDDSDRPYLLRSTNGLRWSQGPRTAVPGRSSAIPDNEEWLRYAGGALRISTQVDLGGTPHRINWAIAALRSTDGVRWTRSVGAVGNRNVQIQGVTWSDDTALQVGTWSPHGSRVSTLWRSVGGTMRAQPVRFQAPPDGPPDVRVHAAAGDSGHYVAVGEAGGRAAFWRSADGRHWTRAERVGADDPPGPAAATGLTRGPAGWVAAGSETGRRGVPVPTLWRSTDGRRWAVETDRRGYAQVRDGGEFTALTHGAHGYVALGYAGVDDSYQRDTFAVSSRDGVHWQAGRSARTDPPRQQGDGSVVRPSAFVTGGVLAVRAVTAAADGYLAVGSADDLPAAWRSPDGVAWSRTDLPTVSAEPRNDEVDVVATRGRDAVALGRRSDEPPDTTSRPGLAIHRRRGAMGGRGGALVRRARPRPRARPGRSRPRGEHRVRPGREHRHGAGGQPGRRRLAVAAHRSGPPRRARRAADHRPER